MISVARRELLHADRVQVLAHVGPVHCRVQDVARLAAGAADEHGACPLVVVLAYGGSAFRRLVVGMGVHGEEAQLVHGSHASQTCAS